MNKLGLIVLQKWMACMFTRTKRIIKQERGVRSEEVKRNRANPPTVPHGLLFKMTLGKKSSSAPSLAAWPLPSFSHLFSPFLHASTSSPPCSDPPSPPHIVSSLAKARMLQPGGCGQECAQSPRACLLHLIPECLFRLSHKLAAVLVLASRWSLWDGKPAMLRW